MNPLTRLFKKQSVPQGVTLEIQSGFTAFSGTAYGSAAFRSAVDAIARHAAKLQGHTNEPGLERLLRESPNAYMTAYDLLYKTATAYFTANNAFILIDRTDSRIRALFPLSPASVEFVGATGGDLYIRLIFADGRQVLLPYGDLIHLRRHFATNELLGSDNAPLYPLIDTAHTLNEATGAAVKNATNIRGILKWAYFRHLSGREYHAANAEHMQEEVLFTINWRNDVTTAHVIRYNGVLWNITRVDTFEGYKTDISLYCKRR